MKHLHLLLVLATLLIWVIASTGFSSCFCAGSAAATSNPDVAILSVTLGDNESNRNETNPPFSSSTPTPETYELLTMTQFVLLCVFSFLCFYGSLCISSVAVGESYTGIGSPFSSIRVFLIEVFEMCRQRAYSVGISPEEAETPSIYA